MHFKCLLFTVLLMFSLVCKGEDIFVPIDEPTGEETDSMNQASPVSPANLTSLTNVTTPAKVPSVLSPRDSLKKDSVVLPTTLSSMLKQYSRNKYGSTLVQEDDTLVVLKPRPLLAVAENFGLNALVLGWDYFIQNRDYARISKNVLEHNFHTGLVWDNDSFSGNQFSHPFHGSMFYNTARENGLTFWQSIPFPVAGSLSWEFFCETNEPAVNDVLSTGIGGVLLGEVCHRVSDLILDETAWGVERMVREVFGNLINPVRGVKRLVRGQWWRRSTSRGKEEPDVPVDIRLGTGCRYLSSKSHFRDGMNEPYVYFDMTYNDRFDNSGHDPFDWFRIKMLFNFSSKQSTVGDFDIRGRLANILLHSKNEFWKFDLGLYQLFKYVETYPTGGDNGTHAGALSTQREFNQNVSDFPVISEAVSVGGGAYSEYDYKHLRLNNDLIVAGVILGGQRSDYYPCRSYNFSHGFSVRNDFETTLYNRLTIGDDFYYARFFTFGKYNPEELRFRLDNGKRVSTPGDTGQSSIVVNRLYVITEFIKGVNLKFEGVLHFRHSNYRDYPSVSGRSYELNIGLVCKL